VYGLEAKDVDLKKRAWLVKNKTRWATGERRRTVYLNELATELTRRLVDRHPTGPLFRNRKGGKWTNCAVSARMRRLADRLQIGPGACAYSLRHLFVTNALEDGINPATVAALVGHKDLNMIMRVYSHLPSRTAHLQQAAEKVRKPY
jgi:integrase